MSKLKIGDKYYYPNKEFEDIYFLEKHKCVLSGFYEGLVLLQPDDHKLYTVFAIEVDGKLIAIGHGVEFRGHDSERVLRRPFELQKV